jgi:ABC-type multidrug transport system ATPase subunit
MINDQLTIEVSELGKRFNREWIFRKLSYSFHSGKTYAITGPNGSGKSTLMQVLWGQLPQSSGRLNYAMNGKVIPVEDVFQHLAIATPYLDLIEELTLTEHLHFHFKMRKPANGLSIPEIIDRLYLSDNSDKPIANFSSGMKQRVKLGLAFFTEASVLFLDEPGTNLDDQAFAWYKQNLEQLPPAKIIFIASNQKAEYPIESTLISITNYK